MEMFPILNTALLQNIFCISLRPQRLHKETCFITGKRKAFLFWVHIKDTAGMFSWHSFHLNHVSSAFNENSHALVHFPGCVSIMVASTLVQVKQLNEAKVNHLPEYRKSNTFVCIVFVTRWCINIENSSGAWKWRMHFLSDSWPLNLSLPVLTTAQRGMLWVSSLKLLRQAVSYNNNKKKKLLNWLLRRRKQSLVEKKAPRHDDSALVKLWIKQDGRSPFTSFVTSAPWSKVFFFLSLR